MLTFSSLPISDSNNNHKKSRRPPSKGAFGFYKSTWLPSMLILKLLFKPYQQLWLYSTTCVRCSQQLDNKEENEFCIYLVEQIRCEPMGSEHQQKYSRPSSFHCPPFFLHAATSRSYLVPPGAAPLAARLAGLLVSNGSLSIASGDLSSCPHEPTFIQGRSG